jgi:hypothetical protein
MASVSANNNKVYITGETQPKIDQNKTANGEKTHEPKERQA